ncbi:MAG TPA: S53 family peptidase [Candidatus Baltobacteraceae bacterium]|nr:S53 family peptidase [Candidatus Baltobacteraceae bacterium]
MDEERWVVPGSTRERPPGEFVAASDPAERVTVTVIVRSKHSSAPPPGHLTREEYAGAYGAGEGDLERVEAFARDHRLSVIERDPARRTIRLEGNVAQMSEAFGVSLSTYKVESKSFRARTGTISLPPSLQNVIEAVLGLDTRPQARPHFQIAEHAATSFTPPQIAALYDFPSGVDGTGETIGIIELGGGYTAADFSAYCAQLGVSEPAVTIVTVDGATNSPGSDADTEVMLDVEMVGTIAHGAKIVLYFTPNTDQGFIDAVTTAVHDQTNEPSVISISWGAPESEWTSAAMNALDSACAAAAAMGVTVCVASGDGGSSDGVNDGAPHADFPASSPHALGCGATTVSASGGEINSEVAWSDSGGGVSAVFALPSWQINANVPAPPDPSGGRGVPDVCADGDPNTGYAIRVNGTSEVVGGTSASAPLWAALIALMNQQLGTSAGFLNPKLYTLAGYPNSPGPLHDITSGSNGAYEAGTGWDPVTGLGSPDGARLETALR